MSLFCVKYLIELNSSEVLFISSKVLIYKKAFLPSFNLFDVEKQTLFKQYKINRVFQDKQICHICQNSQQI